MGKANYQLAREEALKLLDRMAYTKPPVDPVEICKKLGIDVYFQSFTFSDVDDSISGIFSTEDNCIQINDEEPIDRKTFTVAHELGHKQLHEDWLKENQYDTIYRSNYLGGATDFREQEANCFAANLLVPRFMLGKYKEDATVAQLSKLFIVSEQVIRYRLRNEYGR